MPAKRPSSDTTILPQDFDSPRSAKRPRLNGSAQKPPRPLLPYSTKPTFAVSLSSGSRSDGNTRGASGAVSYTTFQFVSSPQPPGRDAAAAELLGAPSVAPGRLTDASIPAAAEVTYAALDAEHDFLSDADLRCRTVASCGISPDSPDASPSCETDACDAIVAVRVSNSPDALKFQSLPLEFLRIEFLSVILRAHNVPRSGPRTQDRYLQLALRHRCNRMCESVRFVLTTEHRPLRTVDYDRISVMCRRLMSLDGVDDPFPPAKDEDVRLDVIRKWLFLFSDAELQLLVCAVCSGFVFRDHSSTRTLQRDHLDVLTNPSLPAHLFPQGYDRRLVGDALLDEQGIIQCRPECVVTACNTCWARLRVLSLPPLSLANDNYTAWDNLPLEIQALFLKATPIELSLVARNRVRCTIYKFTAKASDADGEYDAPAFFHPQYYTKGNIISYVNGNLDLLDVLPPAPDALEATISVIFVGKILPPPEELDRLTPLLVRRHVVVPLLKWLIANDPEYDGVEYSASNLDALLPGRREGVPCGLRMQLVTQSGTEDPGAPTVPTEDYDELREGELPVTSVGVVAKSFETQSVQQQKLASMLMWKRKGATSWAISHGADPVPEWDNPSYFTRLFPHLFPFGIGGLNNPNRRVPIPFEDHVRHLLNSSSRRFATDHVFQYVALNIAQRKRVRQGVRWKVGRSLWEPAHEFLAHVDVTAIKRLAARSAANKGHVAPQDDDEKRVTDFMRLLKNVQVNVPGTPAAKKTMRNQIRSQMHYRGLPALFISLSPADMYHPLFCKLAGLEVHLNDRIQTSYPNAHQRAYLVAKNPTAAAQFFDKMVTAFIDVVLGMKNDGNGLFGKVTAYYATVEAQGRGSLHTHLLVWIAGSLPPQLLRTRMQSDSDFKQSLFNWLHDIISTHVPGNSGVVKPEDAGRVKRKRGAPHSGTMKCPHPDDRDFRSEWDRQLLQVTYESHYHTHNATCWKYLKPGQPKIPALCRMRMSGFTRAETVLDTESGSILLRRWHPEINQHNPTLSMLARCNNDVKFIGSGEAAKALTYYVTDYITKDNLPTDEAFCALEKLVIRISDPKNADPLQGVRLQEVYNRSDAGVRFLTRACNGLMACREVSAQEAALFFHKSGNSDHYTNDTFVTIAWGTIIRWIVEQERGTKVDAAPLTSAIAPAPNRANPGDEDVDFNGMQQVPSTQLDNYRWRGDALGHLGLYWFYGLTAVITTKSEDQRYSSYQNFDFRATPRVPFREEHPSYSTKMLRLRERMAVPCIVGPTLPRGDHPDQYVDYCRAMLVLFKPWREWTDLKTVEQTWVQAYETYEFDPDSRRIMRNFAAAHECKDASDAYRELRRAGVIVHDVISEEIYDKALASSKRETDEDLSQWLNENHPGLVGLVGAHDAEDSDYTVSELDDGDILLNRTQMDKADKAREDVRKMWRHVAQDADHQRPNPSMDRAELNNEHTAAEIGEFKAQTARLKAELPMWVDCGDAADEDIHGDDADERVHRWFADVEGVRLVHAPAEPVDGDDMPAIIADIVRSYAFNEEQTRAFGIVAGHRLALSLEQLLMFVVGSGGTGKSHIVRGWDEFFVRIKGEDELKKAAPTGIASFLIRAETLHALLKLYLKELSAAMLEVLQSVWRCVRYLIVDEVSMVGARMLADISRRLQAIFANDLPFGGVNVVFIGDPRQLPPVGDKCPWSEPGPKDPATSTAKGQLLAYGRSLWRRLNHVVILKQNYRQKEDPAYQALLQNVAEGIATETDCTTLRRRQLGVARFTSAFDDAPLVTANKTVRDEWNVHAVKRFAQKTGQEYVEYVAIDRANGQLLGQRDRERLLMKSTSETRERLSRLPLVVGMRVMVLTNLVTRGGVVNGAEGIVHRIIYSDAPTGERYLLCVLVKVEGCILQYPDLEQGVVPIVPDARYFKVRRKDQRTLSVVRWQVPLLPAYAYTDFKSQGRTLLHAILDLASAKSRESVYVMLSRVICLHNVLILRPFRRTHVTSTLPGDTYRFLQGVEVLDRATTQAWRDSALYNHIRSSGA